VRLRALFSIAVIAVTLSNATAATADPGAQRDKTKARQAQVQGQLNLALASDATVEAQLNQLTAAVTAQQNLLDDARNAQAAADASVRAATRQLADLSSRLDQTRQQLRNVAVRAYMQPTPTVTPGGVTDINELVYRQEFLSVAAVNQVEVIDAFRQTQRDRNEARTVMQHTLDLATRRTKAAADQAAQLATAQHAQATADVELKKRIADLRRESADLAAQESSIEALISARTLQSQAATPSQLPVSATSISGAGLIWPIHGPVTSEFGPRWGGFHPGIDIAPAFGTPIQAAKNGVVILAGSAGGYGNFVLIDHGGGLVTGYAHQSRLAVTQGQTVTQGQLIGYEGSTGDSTGPHLHFEVRINGSPQNPRNYESGGP
jgi:murein DD-endopeptidase MepM/ murein hydrolase activator NlpD